MNIEIEQKGKGHAWTFFDDGVRTISADATNNSDLTRVKMGLHTNYSYVPVIENIDSNKDEYLEAYKRNLKKVDQKIGYIKEEYEDYYLQQLYKKMDSSFEQYYNNIESSKKSDNYFIYQLYTVKEQFEKYKKIKSFSDAEICISYLLLHLLDDSYITQIHEIHLFQTSYDQKNWDFINIYPVQLENDILYFMLEETKTGCDFYEITENDVKHYTKMKGLNKNILKHFVE